ncbi:diguanylate phosphodiesterase [Rhizobium rhizosphaerae]|uniref:Diguanylate phosphodiesterase n=1 Tax=Xaviernesmea rhizosphaerae TaxID=1672749 RepID=A0A1Q9AH36_9HYPH|nr:bifunctional diguanylate cyclase/phosphodiesterase [Xaviernesmea rhizosphaerae]OLP54499.1 diguanylate phosphodiesterase [Xaviernesmea rhizosphaerae]OQP85923.1 diguanylate phosphodiesterase [Xaviernesmea rhizosphaerae]
MTLGKRTFLLLFPTVLFGYMLAAVLVYNAQSRAMLALEQARLSQKLDHAAALFANTVSQARNFYYTIAESDAVHQFVSEPDAAYRSRSLGMRLQQSIRQLLDDPKVFLSFTVLRPDMEEAYYFENSNNPFAELSPQQIELGRKLQEGGEVRTFAYLADAPTQPIIVYSALLDPITLTRPIPSARSQALLMQVGTEPKEFLRLVRQIETDYGSRAVFSDEAPPKVADTLSSVQLPTGQYLSVTIAPQHISAAMRRLKWLLVTGVLAMAFVSIGLTLLLMRRFVIRPITALDQEVTRVMNGEIDAIGETGATVEVGRLTRNIRALHEQSQQSMNLIQRASWTDSLTGISNRSHFQTLAAKAIERAMTYGGHCSLLFIDIDNFKFVNDKYGHGVGDELLRHLARSISEAVSRITVARALPPPILARLSGDEFAVMILAPPGEGATRAACDAILDLFEGGFLLRDKSYPVTASIGVALCPHDAQSLNELVANADAAMYQAKTSGKNRSSRFSRVLQDKRDRVRQIREELQQIDPDDEFHLVYMPVVDPDGKVMGCEALLRWTSPILGRVGPDEFVPIAETSGLFSKIDHWVIDRAIRDHAALAGLFGSDTILAINISSAELHQDDIADRFIEAVARHGVDPHLIEIELTETYSVSLSATAERVLSRLAGKGFGISIDDFGAGYNSLQQLIDYRADAIKLDRGIVEKLAGTGQIEALTALIALCHAREMSVVAEGVDTHEKFSALRHAGCDLFQGYLISRPLVLTELAAWALTRSSSYGIIATEPQAPLLIA